MLKEWECVAVERNEAMMMSLTLGETRDLSEIVEVLEPCAFTNRQTKRTTPW